MYKVEASHNTAKQLKEIYNRDAKLYFRLMNVIAGLPVNPYMGKKLKGLLKGNYSLRVGDYRLIYTVHKHKLIIYLIDIGHRSSIYR